ncbi:MAG: hypothetical protein NT105_23830 [Verrucomicrobia bacterium]|nr:hypothetical protein [Verrucomicrobiota bacterium]
MTALSPRQIELKRLISECREMQGRWGGLRALLERIERDDGLEHIGGELEALALAHNAAATRWTETRQIVDRLWSLIVETSAAAVGTDRWAGRSDPLGAPSGRALPEQP